MPGNPTIDLDVRNFPSNGSDGYTDTTASNNTVYSYRYSGGGGHSGGDVTCTVGQGRVTIVVHVQSDPRYSISTVGFTNDPNQQLSLQSHAPTTATIQNLNTVVQTAHYKVTVSDSTANCTVPCDPAIINK
ncbi:MAG: hypothetical protein ABI365_06710 [Lysobacteraceae bacterium]